MMLRTLMLLSLVFWAAAPAAPGQEVSSNHTGVGLETGMMKLVGGDVDLSNLNPFMVLRLQRGLNEYWSLEGAIKYGWVRPGVSDPNVEARWSTTGHTSLYTVIWQPSLGLRYCALPAQSFSPFVGLALGLTSWRVRDQSNDSAGLFPHGPVVMGLADDGSSRQLAKTNITPTVTLGAQLKTSASLTVDLGVRYNILTGNDLDNVGFSSFEDYRRFADANNGLMEGFVGLTFQLGSPDRDKDGIPNELDACPDDPEDYDRYEDQDGCPDPDNDSDGVPDLDDLCPDDPEDVDGFADEDGCPDPDNDHDGVLDINDACPQQPEDKDGFEDLDGCPELDNDGDGVLDSADQCPDTPPGLEVDTKGCPVATETPSSTILEGVNFLSGSAELTPTSLLVLQEVAQSLIANPDVRIEIQGHTDSSGHEEANKELSLQRALAVRDVLIRYGVDPTRLRAVGFGSDRPIAPNDTPEDRARNRRVEIHRLGF